MATFSVRAKVFLGATIAIGAGLCLSQLPDWSGSRIWPLILLVVIATLTHIFQVSGLIPGSYYNASVVVYSFTLFTFGLPEAVWIAVLSNILAWLRGRQHIPWYAQAFNIGSLVIPLSAADVTYRLTTSNPELLNVLSVLGILAAGLVFILINHFMIGVVHWLVDGESFASSGMFDRVHLSTDITLFAMGGASALIWPLNPFLVLLIISPLYLIYLTLQLPALQRRAESDAKTGLFNASYFRRTLELELARAKRFNRPLNVVMADLDNLRQINNTYGHFAGDAVLIGIASMLRHSVRDYDCVGRFGGDEFAILLLESDTGDVRSRMESIRAAIEAAVFNDSTGHTPIKTTMSFGIAARQYAGQSAEMIMENADTALYQAKQNGRNRVCTFAEAEQGAAEQEPANTETGRKRESASEHSAPPDPGPWITRDQRIVSPLARSASLNQAANDLD